MAPRPLSKPPVSFFTRDEVPLIFIRESHQWPRKILINDGKRLFQQHLTSADLKPVFEVDVKRETRRLTSGGLAIDLSLDNGAVVAGREREPIHEIELELVAGDVNELFAEAQRISDA